MDLFRCFLQMRLLLMFVIQTEHQQPITLRLIYLSLGNNGRWCCCCSRTLACEHFYSLLRARLTFHNTQRRNAHQRKCPRIGKCVFVTLPSSQDYWFPVSHTQWDQCWPSAVSLAALRVRLWHIVTSSQPESVNETGPHTVERLTWELWAGFIWRTRHLSGDTDTVISEKWTPTARFGSWSLAVALSFLSHSTKTFSLQQVFVHKTKEIQPDPIKCWLSQINNSKPM